MTEWKFDWTWIWFCSIHRFLVTMQYYKVRRDLRYWFDSKSKSFCDKLRLPHKNSACQNLWSLAISTGSSISISITYIVFLTKMQKRQTAKIRFAFMISKNTSCLKSFWALLYCKYQKSFSSLSYLQELIIVVTGRKILLLKNKKINRPWSVPPIEAVFATARCWRHEQERIQLCMGVAPSAIPRATSKSRQQDYSGKYGLRRDRMARLRILL